jgi:hypothetical protein
MARSGPGAPLIEREIAVPEDRHPLERVQCQLGRRVHLRFEIMEGVLNLLTSEDEARHLEVNAARKAEKK